MTGLLEAAGIAFGVLVMVVSSLSLIMSTRNRTTNRILTESNEAFERENKRLHDEANRDRETARAANARNTERIAALEAENRVLKNVVTGKDAIEGLTIALTEAEAMRHREHMDMQEQLRHSTRVLADAVNSVVGAIHVHERNAVARAERRELDGTMEDRRGGRRADDDEGIGV